jgi:hypothetical protein
VGCSCSTSGTCLRRTKIYINNKHLYTFAQLKIPCTTDNSDYSINMDYTNIRVRWRIMFCWLVVASCQVRSISATINYTYDDKMCLVTDHQRPVLTSYNLLWGDPSWLLYVRRLILSIHEELINFAL